MKNQNINLAMIVSGVVLIIVALMNYSRNKTMAVAGIVIGGGLTVLGIMNYSRNKAAMELIKCCTQRDANCRCTAYEWKKSSDCATVPCPSLDVQPIVVINREASNDNGGNGNGGATA